jgi:hypothetical protein
VRNFTPLNKGKVSIYQLVKRFWGRFSLLKRRFHVGFYVKSKEGTHMPWGRAGWEQKRDLGLKNGSLSRG